jgi:S1-C subfamily serine protease
MSNTILDLSNAFAEATQKAGQSTVLVDARRRMPASGIAYSAEFILTANHVVEREEDLRVWLADATQVPASLAGRDPGSDLALLKLEQALATPAQVSHEARLGQLALAIGRPSSSGLEASLGVISAIGGPVRTPLGLVDRYFRIDATPYPGFSGGPLADAAGNVLGINTSGFGPGMFIAIPASVAWKSADELAKHGSIKRGYLGIRSQTVEIPTAGQGSLKREQATGLLIVGIEADTPAEKSDLLVGDILVGINGHSVTDHDDLFAVLAGDVVGKATQAEVLRGGQPQTVSVTIEARPAEHQHAHHGRGRRRG